MFAHMRWLDRFRWRALILGGATLTLALLAWFPERYLATSSFTPTDRDSLGLSGTLGQLGALNSVFGNQAAVEVALRIGNSDDVRDEVIANSKLKDRLATEGRTALQRYLKSSVTIRSLRGGIITIEMQSRDPAVAEDIVTAYQAAIRDSLGKVARRQTAYKRQVLMQLVRDAGLELANAQSAYDEFRISNRYVEPRASMSAISDRIPALEAAIRAKEVQLATTRQVFTDNNLTVRQMQAELAALRGQLAAARSTTPSEDQSVGDLVSNSRRLYLLERDLEVAKSLHDGYIRYLRGTAVEDLTSDANLRLLEPPHIDTERQVWLPALALAIAIFLLWVAIEAYRLRPATGDRIKARDDD
jgi:uncharacterized coiled-coil protein SlyX